MLVTIQGQDPFWTLITQQDREQLASVSEWAQYMYDDQGMGEDVHNLTVKINGSRLQRESIMPLDVFRDGDRAEISFDFIP